MCYLGAHYWRVCQVPDVSNDVGAQVPEAPQEFGRLEGLYHQLRFAPDPEAADADGTECMVRLPPLSPPPSLILFSRYAQIDVTPAGVKDAGISTDDFAKNES
jgi:hypothetical protein